MTDVCKTALLPTKSSSDEGSGFRYGLNAEASLPLAQSTPAVSYNKTRLCWIVVTLWDCHIHADIVRALSWIFFMYFILSEWIESKISEECGGWVGNETSASNLNWKYIGYPAIFDTLFLPDLHIFPTYADVPSWNFLQKGLFT